MDHPKFAGKHVYVMGLGRFGGGVGVTRFLAEQGATVTVGDTGNRQSLAESIDQIKDLIDASVVNLQLGEHEESDLNGVDILVVNPAVPMPWTNSFILYALSNGVEVTTEIEMVYQLLDPAKVIAVTGSAGKSTTCAMAHHILSKLGHDVLLGGNFGGSLLGQLEQIHAGAFVVLEVSSAMLYWLGKNGAMSCSPPAVACVTNCQPNHIDWHGSWEHYEASKKNLVQCAADGNAVILGEDLQEWGAQLAIESTIIGSESAISGCAVPGKHNAKNAGIAIAAVEAMLKMHSIDIPHSTIEDAVRSYSGLEHRLALVHESQGIRYFNDSKSTVPEATVLAVEALSDLVDLSRIHLIAGGYDKGVDLSMISGRSGELAGLYTIGDTGESIVRSCEDATGYAKYFVDLKGAMQAIKQRTREGDVVVLSPGCASWDQFTNYQHRGQQFMELARIKVISTGHNLDGTQL
ncbi:MAG: UDP-N-acetylmuramoyl-L-alanine--D-glutamate ligase [Phycisphaerales bacterium]